MSTTSSPKRERNEPSGDHDADKKQRIDEPSEEESSRPAHIKDNTALYLGDKLVFMIDKTPIDLIQHYIDEYDLQATPYEKSNLYFLLNTFYHSINLESFRK